MIDAFILQREEIKKGKKYIVHFLHSYKRISTPKAFPHKEIAYVCKLHVMCGKCTYDNDTVLFCIITDFFLFIPEFVTGNTQECSGFSLFTFT